jgi:(1->4)-alpha-D-glucan 1-alpha-D-glucosylmutase
MLATATHDHKRGEDVRMRLAVLSELPELWAAFIEKMTSLTNIFKTEVDDETAPSATDEYLLYQTLVGTWPYDIEGPDYGGIEVYAGRITDYMIKAAREGKLRTNWTAVNEDYESALKRFIETLLNPKRGRVILKEIETFVLRIARAGAVNSLSQVLLKLTSPGVPDTYQGCDLWDFSLVDPDNRRAVDFPLRQRLLSEWEQAAGTAEVCRSLVHGWRNGAVKQYLTMMTLGFRKRFPDLFAGGSYEPLETEGEHAQRLLAFRREYGGAAVITVVPRLAAPLLEGEEDPLPRKWGDTRLLVSGPACHDLFSGREYPGAESFAAADLFADFPAALLVQLPPSENQDEEGDDKNEG